MNTVFSIRNQQGLFLTKQQEWASGADNHSLFRTTHKDEAINTVFELSSRDIYVRAEIIACATDAKGNPIVEISVIESGAELDVASDEAVSDEPQSA
jgi:hypothetical protein